MSLISVGTRHCVKLSEEEIKDVLAIRKRLADKIAAYQKEIRLLEQNESILGRLLSESSFTSAADMLGGEGQEQVRTADPSGETGAPPAPASGTTPDAGQPREEDDAGREPSARIREGGTDRALADVYRDGDRISIVITYNGDATLTENTEPFRSFFVEKILEGMRKEDAQSAEIPEGDALAYEISSDPGTGRIQGILIRNCRDERRAGEIIKTAEWSLTRMLGNAAAAGG